MNLVDLVEGEKFWGKWGVDFMEKRGKMMGKKLDPRTTLQIHGSNPTKSHQNQQITKILVRLFLVGDFRIRTKTNKIRLEGGGRTPRCESTKALIQDDVG